MRCAMRDSSRWFCRPSDRIFSASSYRASQPASQSVSHIFNLFDNIRKSATLQIVRSTHTEKANGVRGLPFERGIQVLRTKRPSFAAASAASSYEVGCDADMRAINAWCNWVDLGQFSCEQSSKSKAEKKGDLCSSRQ